MSPTEVIIISFSFPYSSFLCSSGTTRKEESQCEKLTFCRIAQVVTTTNASTLISAGWKRIAGVQINNREIGGVGLHIIIGCALLGGVALFY